MANYANAKWGSPSPGVGATITWSFADNPLLTRSGFEGYRTFDSTIASGYRQQVQNAMAAWEAVANIDLVEVADSAFSNIRVGNLYIDGAAQPGSSSTVGETSYWARNGVLSAAQIYFDTDAYSGTSFYQIAVHEIGHALGLDHSDLTNAVMYRMVNSLNRSGVLSNDDVNGIQYLYGAKQVAAAISSLATLRTAFTHIMRIDPTSSDATRTVIALTDGSTVTNPTFSQAQGLVPLATEVDAGRMTLANAVRTIGNYADATTSVASLSYQFFTGRTPTAAGLDYLVHSSANPNDLNDPYYARFNVENRYINFAVNLGKLGEGRPAFQSKYGGLSLFDTVKTAYTEIFGSTPTDAKVNEILTATVSVGGTGMSRASYFAYYGQDGSSGIGTKAAAVGFLLVEAVKADLGPYALANERFLADLADGTAIYNTDLKASYAAAQGPIYTGLTDGAGEGWAYDHHVDGVYEFVGVTPEQEAALVGALPPRYDDWLLTA